MLSTHRSSRRFCNATWCVAALLAFVASGCREESLLIEDVGTTPIAEARVLDHDDKQVTIDYDGQPVSVTLDASRSSDADGRIVTYRWLSGSLASTEADSGVARGRSATEDDPAWPDDVVQPEVELDDGSYAFMLWVIDDSGVTSDPDLVRIDVRPPQAGESDP